MNIQSNWSETEKNISKYGLIYIPRPLLTCDSNPDGENDESKDEEDDGPEPRELGSNARYFPTRISAQYQLKPCNYFSFKTSRGY